MKKLQNNVQKIWVDFPTVPLQHLSPSYLHLHNFRARQHERMRAAGWPIPQKQAKNDSN